MCQNWYSIIGLCLDVLGFLLIFREWYWAIGLQGGEAVQDAGEIAERSARRRRGEPEPEEEDPRYRLHGRFAGLKKRRILFHFGAALIVLGFVGQVLGSWPHLFRSC